MIGSRAWRNALLLVGSAGLMGANAWVFPPAVELLQPDSAGYLAGEGARGPAYTAFLGWCGALDGNPAAAVPVQLALFFAALGALSAAVSALAQRLWPGLLCLVFAGANPAVTKYAFSILTEAPTMAALMAGAAAALAGIARRSHAWLAMAAVFVACAIALRPTSWAFLVPIVIAALLVKRGAGARLGGAALAAAIPLLLQLLIADPASAAARREFLALGLFGKFALIGESKGTAMHEKLAQRTDLMRAAIAAQPDFAARWILRTAYAEHLRYGVWDDFAAENAIEPSQRLSAVLGIAAADPVGYGHEIARQLRAFWSVPDAMTSAEARRASDGYAGVPELQPPPQPKVYPSAVVYALRSISFGGLAISIAVLAALTVPRLRTPTLAAAAFLAMSVHGYSLMLALVHSSLPRYVLEAWPLLGAMASLALAAIADTARTAKARPALAGTASL